MRCPQAARAAVSLYFSCISAVSQPYLSCIAAVVRADSRAPAALAARDEAPAGAVQGKREVGGDVGLARYRQRRVALQVTGLARHLAPLDGFHTDARHRLDLLVLGGFGIAGQFVLSPCIHGRFCLVGRGTGELGVLALHAGPGGAILAQRQYHKSIAHARAHAHQAHGLLRDLRRGTATRHAGHAHRERDPRRILGHASIDGGLDLFDGGGGGGGVRRRQGKQCGNGESKGNGKRTHGMLTVSKGQRV